MKSIYLLRHTEAEKRSDIKDFERSLTKNGELEVLDLSKKLLSTDFSFDKILCSSSERTVQTCSILLETIGSDLPITKIDSLYNPFMANLLDVIIALDNTHKNILIVSHNPTITEFANYLLGYKKQQLSFETANMAKLNLSINSWEEIHEECADTSFFL